MPSGELIGQATDHELIFSPDRVERIGRILGEVELLVDGSTFSITFPNGAGLQFGGDSTMIHGEILQRTLVTFNRRSARRTGADFNQHLSNIDRVERDPENDFAVRFVIDSEDGSDVLTVTREGIATFTHESMTTVTSDPL